MDQATKRRLDELERRLEAVEDRLDALEGLGAPIEPPDRPEYQGP